MWLAQPMSPRSVLRFAGAVLLVIGTLALHGGLTTSLMVAIALLGVVATVTGSFFADTVIAGRFGGFDCYDGTHEWHERIHENLTLTGRHRDFESASFNRNWRAMCSDPRIARDPLSLRVRRCCSSADSPSGLTGKGRSRRLWRPGWVAPSWWRGTCRFTRSRIMDVMPTPSDRGRQRARLTPDRPRVAAPPRPDSPPLRDRQGLREAREGKRRRGLTRARSMAVAPGAAVAVQAQQENILTPVRGRLIAVAEACPDLKADQNLQRLQQELTNTEDRIVSSLFGFTRAEHFEIEDSAAPSDAPCGVLEASSSRGRLLRLDGVHEA